MAAAGGRRGAAHKPKSPPPDPHGISPDNPPPPAPAPDEAARRDLADIMTGGVARPLDREEQRVLDGIARRLPLSRDAYAIADCQSSWWDRLADRVAAVGGSWGFIFGFFAVLAAWVLINSGRLPRLGFDVYPFIFLNLLLSMLAAIQAPIILMSQNRQSQRDRVAAAHDYAVNLRAELEILRLHEKLDAMRAAQDAALAQQQETLIALLRKELAAHGVAAMPPTG